MKIRSLVLGSALLLVGTTFGDEPTTPDAEQAGLQKAESIPILLPPPISNRSKSKRDGWSKTAEPEKSKSGETQQTSLDSSKESVESGFRPLLTGRKLKGWTVQNGSPDAWIRDGDVIRCESREGGWLRTEEQFSDFHVKFEYQLQPGGNSGFGVRSPSTGSPTFDGIEIQLIDESSSKYPDLQPIQLTGSIYYQAARQQTADLKPVGEWNECEILCRGDELKVIVNRNVVNKLNLMIPPESQKKNWRLGERPPIGHFALQSHSTPVAFRNLRVKDLTREAKADVRYRDLVVGDGESIDEAEEFSVHYTGQLGSGQRFADTRDLGKPVELSMDEVIPGWEIGLAGMKVGGKRRLIVPPEQGFGDFGATNLIPPGATLVFEVELCAVQR